MIMHPGLLTVAAEQAGIKIPPNIDNYDREKFPYWHVFATIQVGRRMPAPTSHWHNAELIAAIPAWEIKKTTYQDLLVKGLE